jgi:cold shock CspA family protein
MFDEPRGLGTVTSDDGSELAFHCTAIAGGQRKISEGARVTFTTAAGHLGKAEAIGVTVVTLSADSTGYTETTSYTERTGYTDATAVVKDEEVAPETPGDSEQKTATSSEPPVAEEQAMTTAPTPATPSEAEKAPGEVKES